MTHSLRSDVFPHRTLSHLTSSDVLPPEDTLKNIVDRDQLYPFITRLESQRIYYYLKALDNATRKNFQDTVARLGQGSCHPPIFDAIYKKLSKKSSRLQSGTRVDSRTSFKFRTHFFIVKPCFTFGIRNVPADTCHILQVGSTPMLLFFYGKSQQLTKKPVLREKHFDSTEQFKFKLRRVEAHEKVRLPPKTTYVLCAEKRSYFGLHVVAADARLPFPTMNPIPEILPKTLPATVPDTLYGRPIQTPLIEDVTLGDSSSEDEEDAFPEPATPNRIPSPAVPFQKTFASLDLLASTAAAAISSRTPASSHVTAATSPVCFRVPGTPASSRVPGTPASSRVPGTATSTIPLPRSLSHRNLPDVLRFVHEHQRLRNQWMGPIEKVSLQPESSDIMEVALDLSLPRQQTLEAMDLSTTRPETPASHPTEEQPIQEPVSPLSRHTPLERVQPTTSPSPRDILNDMVRNLQEEERDSRDLFQSPQQPTTPFQMENTPQSHQQPPTPYQWNDIFQSPQQPTTLFQMDDTPQQPPTLYQGNDTLQSHQQPTTLYQGNDMLQSPQQPTTLLHYENIQSVSYSIFTEL